MKGFRVSQDSAPLPSFSDWRHSGMYRGPAKCEKLRGIPGIWGGHSFSFFLDVLIIRIRVFGGPILESPFSGKVPFEAEQGLRFSGFRVVRVYG